MQGFSPKLHPELLEFKAMHVQGMLLRVWVCVWWSAGQRLMSRHRSPSTV